MSNFFGSRLILAMFFFALFFANATAFSIEGIDLNEAAFVDQIASFGVGIKNDVNSQTITLKLLDNGVFKNFVSAVFDINEERTVLMEWNPETEGTHTIEIKAESTLTGEIQSKTTQISVTTWTAFDFLIEPEDIDFNAGIQVGKTTQITAMVRNNGSEAHSGVLVRVYHGQETLSTLLTSQTIALPAGGSETISFDYMPQVSGVDSIIVKIDPNNEIVESDETNNKAERTINVGFTETGESTYTISLFLRSDKKDCVVVMNNNDKFFHKGIKGDEESNFFVDFDLIDNTGNVIFSASGYEGDEFVKPSRTVRVIAVNEVIATIVVVYTFQNAVSYTTCETNIGELTESLSKCERDLEELREHSSGLGIEKMDCISEKSSLNKDLLSCKEDKADCLEKKMVCETNLARTTSDYNAQMSAIRFTEKESCGSQLLSKDSELQSRNAELEAAMNYGHTGFILFFAMIMIFAALYHKGVIAL